MQRPGFLRAVCVFLPGLAAAPDAYTVGVLFPAIPTSDLAFARLELLAAVNALYLAVALVAGWAKAHPLLAVKFVLTV